MDAKAKIGLAIGGIVLAGMVAYVLMPSSKPEGTQGALSKAEPVAPTEAVPATAPTSGPVTADPFATPFAGTTMPSEPSVSVGGPSSPTTAGRDPWGVLDTGGTAHAMAPGSGRESTGFGDLGAVPAPMAHDEPLNTMPHSYKIQQGDSLRSISQKLLGSPKYVAQIQRANPGLNASHMKVGQEIKLPEIDGAAATAARGEHPSAAGSTAAAAVGRTYKVQSGDSLRKISRKIYGREDMWQKIYDLNRKQIGPDASRLRAGMTLQLPEK